MKRSRTVLLAAIALSPLMAGPSIATSRPLMGGEAVLGKWILARAGTEKTCPVTLSQKAGVNQAKASATCLKALNLRSITQWRGAPDGIALADKEGDTVVFFSLVNASFFRGAGNFRDLTLTRPKP
jgi:hypothetical protein